MTKRKTSLVGKPKIIIDPEWLKQNRGYLHDEIDSQSVWGMPEGDEYLPKIWYEDAQWIMCIKTPTTSIKVPKFTIFLGVPDESSDLKRLQIPKKYWKVFTPYGELRLHLHEATVIDITKYMDFIGTDLRMKQLTDNPQITDSIIKDRLFYIKSRGISKIDAFKMVLGDLKDPQLFYLVFRKEYQQIYCRDWEFVGDEIEFNSPEQIKVNGEKQKREINKNIRRRNAFDNQ